MSAGILKLLPLYWSLPLLLPLYAGIGTCLPKSKRILFHWAYFSIFASISVSSPFYWDSCRLLSHQLTVLAPARMILLFECYSWPHQEIRNLKKKIVVHAWEYLKHLVFVMLVLSSLYPTAVEIPDFSPVSYSQLFIFCLSFHVV